MYKIWDRKSFRSQRSLVVVAGMKKTNDHAEPTKVYAKKKEDAFLNTILDVSIHVF